MDQKLNQHRIEIQGQKPTRLKKQLKRFEDYIQEAPAHEEDAQAMDSRLGPASAMDSEHQPAEPTVQHTEEDMVVQ